MEVILDDEIRGFYLFTESRQRLRTRWTVAWSAVAGLGVAVTLAGVFAMDPHRWTYDGSSATVQRLGVACTSIGASMLLLTFSFRDTARVQVLRRTNLRDGDASGDDAER